MTTLPLTPRQLEVCVLLMRGSKPKEIGERLGITPGSVYQHVDRAKNATGARTTEQLMAMLGSELRGVEVS